MDRKAYLTYIDASFGKGTAKWFLVGKGIEELSVELNPDVETKEDILGESHTNDKGYAPSADVDPYYAEPTDDIYPKIKDIAMNRLKGTACQTKILEVIVDKEEGAFDAWIEDVIVKPQSYGGGTEGFVIPFNVAFNGNRKQGTVTIADKVPTFTEAT